MTHAAQTVSEITLFTEMTAALAGETARAAGSPTELVSITFDVMARGAPATTRIDIVRATKSLVFSQGEIFDEVGRRLIAATAVHKIVR